MPRSCIAQAVDSAASVSSPPRRLTGWQRAASSAPTIRSQEPSTVADAAVSSHPRSATIRRIIDPNGCGSRASGPAPE
jgi:hypothetical protein